MAKSELSRLRDNLKSKIRYYNAKGYDIDPSFVNDLSIEELKQIDTETLLQDIYYEQQKQQYWDSIGADEVDLIIKNFQDSYSKYNSEAKEILDRWLNNLRSMKGDNAVAQMISDARANGLDVTSNIIYGNMIDSFIQDFMEYLPEEDQLGELEMANLLDSIEMQEDWGDIS